MSDTQMRQIEQWINCLAECYASDKAYGNRDAQMNRIFRELTPEFARFYFNHPAEQATHLKRIRAYLAADLE